MAVLIDHVDATLADVVTTAIARHAEVNRYGLIFDASVDSDAKKAVKVAQLKERTIVVR